MRSCDQNLEFELESLEQRAMLAGDVSVRVTGGGDLIVHGDHHDNILEIRENSGQITVEGRSGTTVNGSSTFTHSGQAIDDLRITLKGGNDHVVIRNLQIDGDLHFSGSHGNDQLGVAYGAYEKVSVNMGSGNNRVVLSSFEVGRSVKVSSGHGHDEVGIALNVPDKLSVNTGHGDDRLLIVQTDVHSAHLNTGGGDDEVFVHATTIDSHLKTNLGHGDDDLDFSNAWVGGNATIHAGGGDDHVETSVTVVGTRKILAAEGNTVPNGANRYSWLYNDLVRVWDI